MARSGLSGSGKVRIHVGKCSLWIAMASKGQEGNGVAYIKIYG